MQHFVKDVIVRLSQARAEFVVVGGISAVLQGAPIVTVDLDICYLRQPDNLKRIAEALAPLKPRLRGIPADLVAQFDERCLQLGTNFTLEIGTESLDLLAEMAGIGGYQQIGNSGDDAARGIANRCADELADVLHHGRPPWGLGRRERGVASQTAAVSETVVRLGESSPDDIYRV